MVFDGIRSEDDHGRGLSPTKWSNSDHVHDSLNLFRHYRCTLKSVFSITHAGRTIVVRKKTERVYENKDSGKQNKVSSPDCPEVGTGRIEDDLRKCGKQSAKREDVWCATWSQSCSSMRRLLYT